MTLEALNSAAPLHPHFSNVGLVSWTKRKRSKREFDDNFFASCLIALARSGGATSSSAADQTKHSSSKAANISYTCNLCGRAFSSSRALGRHKASHRSKSPTADADTKLSNSTSTAKTGVSDCTADFLRFHKCLACGDIFPTGQALGGHKRKHYDGFLSRNGGRKSRVSSSDGVTDSTDATSFSDGNCPVDMSPIARNLELKLPLPPSPYLDLTMKF